MKHYNSEITSPASLFSKSPHPEEQEESKAAASDHINHFEASHLLMQHSPVYMQGGDIVRSGGDGQTGGGEWMNRMDGNYNPMINSELLATTSRNLRDIYYQYEFLQNNNQPLEEKKGDHSIPPL